MENEIITCGITEENMGGIHGLGMQDVWKLHAHNILLEKSEGMTNFWRTM
jgi:hypothetical protein